MVIKKIIGNRNSRWIPCINRYHSKTKDPLFVVGAEHLNYEYGLVNLLTKENYDLKIFDLKSSQFINI